MSASPRHDADDPESARQCWSYSSGPRINCTCPVVTPAQAAVEAVIYRNYGGVSSQGRVATVAAEVLDALAKTAEAGQ